MRMGLTKRKRRMYEQIIHSPDQGRKDYRETREYNKGKRKETRRGENRRGEKGREERRSEEKGRG